MTSLVLLGTGVGLGITAIAAGLFPPQSARLVSIGDELTRMLRPSGSSPTLGQDLALLGRSEESLAVATALSLIVGASLPALAYAGTGVLGTHVPVSVLAFACVATGLAGTAAPGLVVRRSAGHARQGLVHSLACWLELVAMAQAGGMGLETALEAASSVAGEASLLRIGRALERARHAGLPPWDGLARLGGEIGVTELEELAASFRLAGTEGARIRSSLSAKSASLRRRETAEAQGRANATTERLFLPAVVLMLGFVVFLLYPAGVTLSRVV